MHTVYGVALGPGDPELITLKGLKVLQASDVIFYPGSLSKGVQNSFVYPILEYHGLQDKELIGFFLDMSGDRAYIKDVYAKTAKQIQTTYLSGKKVSMVCEGDLSLYATLSYVLEELQTLEIPVSLVPGIQALSLGAAQHQVPISLMDEKVAIIPKAKHIDEVHTYFKQFDTLILMKIRSGWNDLYPEFLKQDWQYYYCERLGTDQEFITPDLKAVSQRTIPYFSLLIIKNKAG